MNMKRSKRTNERERESKKKTESNWFVLWVNLYTRFVFESSRRRLLVKIVPFWFGLLIEFSCCPPKRTVCCLSACVHLCTKFHRIRFIFFSRAAFVCVKDCECTRYCCCSIDAKPFRLNSMNLNDILIEKTISTYRFVYVWEDAHAARGCIYGNERAFAILRKCNISISSSSSSNDVPRDKWPNYVRLRLLIFQIPRWCRSHHLLHDTIHTIKPQKKNENSK